MKILIIQTAYLGDVILMTSLVETLAASNPENTIHVLVRKGNESVLFNNPHIAQLHIWDKKSGKYRNLFRLAQEFRKIAFDEVINLHRFLSGGLLSVLSGAKKISGFDKNPVSFLFDRRLPRQYNGVHEIDRNFSLISHISSLSSPLLPKVYPSSQDVEAMEKLVQTPFYILAPASVWFTKQLPMDKWAKLAKMLGEKGLVYLIGSSADKGLCEEIQKLTKSTNVINLSGKISLPELADLMQKAEMVFANDSAPTHLASAVNASVKTFFCSTSPEFGFGPLSANSQIMETDKVLACKPCGLHGKKKCPEGHFLCGDIRIENLV